MIGAVGYAYNVSLPSLHHWFLQRVDIAICFDLMNNQNVRDYINNLNQCNYPRRNIKYYQDESIYTTGTTTTLKIYNKYLEFRKHDMKKLFKTNFDIDKYIEQIQGFIRFECEIHKKKLQDYYKSSYVRVVSVNYRDLKEIWCDEFMRLLKLYKNDLKVVRNKKDIEKRLYSMYTPVRARNLYNFYTSIMVDGLREVKRRTSKTVYYKNIKDLEVANIDLSQKYKLTLETKLIEFNPFEWKEVV